MNRLLGITYYEWRMGVRRWGMWLAFLLASLIYSLDPYPYASGAEAGITAWQAAGSLALYSNMLLPLVGGIVMADRLARDSRLGVQELLRGTPLPRATYVLGKYLGAVLAALTPVLVIWIARLGAICITTGSSEIFLPGLAAFLAITVPAFLFVGAFSVACTAILPVRVYQVLFTGYWFWGNYLNPEFIPTLAGTLLTPSGTFAAAGFFRSGFLPGQYEHTTVEAVLNLLVLAACAALALFALERYLKWQAEKT